MSWNKTDRSFKILINRRVTDAEPSKYWYNEKGDYTLDLHASEIKTEDIPSTPPGADTSVVDVYNYAGRLTLIEDTSVPGKMTWFASSESNTVLAQTDEGARLKDWIPDKYGSGYAIALYDGSDVQIPYSDASGWYFDYPTGILTFANANTDSGSVSSRAPYKIVGYRYIGNKGAGGVTSVGGQNGIQTDQVANAPITSSGNLELDLTYSPTWTGTHTFNGDPATGIVMDGSTSITLSPVNGDDGAPLLWQLSTGPTNPDALAQGQMWFNSGNTRLAFVSDNTPTLKYIAWVGDSPTGSGTAGTLAKWTSSTALGDSIVSESSDILTVAGKIKATSKSFYIPHPIKPGWYLEHGCLEGPENGIYYRGFHEGEEDVTITLPEYWEPLNGDDYDIYITSHGNYSLYVSNKTSKDFTVSRCKTWKWRKKSIRFSFIAVGGRINAPIELEFDATKQSAP